MWIINIILINLSIVLVTDLTLGLIFGARTVKDLVTVTLVNVITNPVAVLCMLSVTMFFSDWEYVCLVAIELAVFFTEGFLCSKFRTFGDKNPYVISLILNIFSFLTGEVINIFL